MTTPQGDSNKPQSNEEAISNAWQIHTAIADWTGKVDNKASFAIGLETVLMGSLVALRGEGWRLETFSWWLPVLLYSVAAVLLGLSILLSGFAVIPILGKTKTLKQHAPRRFIYFGHLRHWKLDDLTRALQHRPILPVLSAQLIETSMIAWRKHRLVQVSMLSALVGSAFLGASIVFN